MVNMPMKLTTAGRRKNLKTTRTDLTALLRLQCLGFIEDREGSGLGDVGYSLPPVRPTLITKIPINLTPEAAVGCRQSRESVVIHRI